MTAKTPEEIRTLVIRTDWLPTEYLTAEHLTRIEGNVYYLRKWLNERPYNIPYHEDKTWSQEDVPDTGHIERICRYVEEIANHYYRPPKFERLEEIAKAQSLNNVDINDLEGILLWLFEQYIGGRHHNTHRRLNDKEYIHKHLHKFTHKQIRKNNMEVDYGKL